MRLETWAAAGVCSGVFSAEAMASESCPAWNISSAKFKISIDHFSIWRLISGRRGWSFDKLSTKSMATNRSWTVCLLAADSAQYNRREAEAMGQKILGQLGKAGKRNNRLIAKTPIPPGTKINRAKTRGTKLAGMVLGRTKRLRFSGWGEDDPWDGW